MGTMTEIGNLLILTFFNLALTVVLLRLLLQLTKVDFYNPISQFIVKVTQPVLKPMRRVIPGLWGIDMATVVLAVLLQMLCISLLLLLSGYAVNLLMLPIWALLGCIGVVSNIYLVAILVSIILSWVAPGSYNPIVLLLHQLTEPVMTPFRKILPPLGGLDLSPILVFLLINIIQILLNSVLNALGMYGQFVVGI